MIAPSNGRVFELQDEVVPRIVSTVADTQGVLPHNMGESLRTKDPSQLTVRGCTAQLLVLQRSTRRPRHSAGRLERAVEQAPAMLLPGPCWRSSSREYNHAFNARPDSLSAAGGRAACHRGCALESPCHHALASSCSSCGVAGLPQCGTARDHTQPDGRIHFRLSGDAYGLCRRLGARLCVVGAARNSIPIILAGTGFALVRCLPEGDYRALESPKRSTCPPLAYEPRARRDQRTTRELEAARKAERALLRATRLRHSARDECAKWWEPELVEKLLDGLRKAGLEIADLQGTASAKPGAQDRKTR